MDSTNEQTKELTKSLSDLTDFNNLKDEGSFRNQLITMLERIATAQEKAMEHLL
jgi:hypothetical protein